MQWRDILQTYKNIIGGRYYYLVFFIWNIWDVRRMEKNRISDLRRLNQNWWLQTSGIEVDIHWCMEPLSHVHTYGLKKHPVDKYTKEDNGITLFKLQFDFI